MTNEQREAIELLERIHVSYFLSGMIEQSNYIVDKAYEADKAIDTVLSLIKEQQEEIAKYEKIYKEYDCYRWVKELNKKDKQIDLMADFIGQDMRCIRPEIKCNKMTHDCKDCVKQYFADLVEKES